MTSPEWVKANVTYTDVQAKNICIQIPIDNFILWNTFLQNQCILNWRSKYQFQQCNLMH